MWALFVKIGDDWKFSGLTEHEEHVTEFEETVANDIDETKDMEVKTTDFFVVKIEGQYEAGKEYFVTNTGENKKDG